MNKTRIEWANFTWNPIKGLCPMGCWYCYARKMYKRFDLPIEPTMDVRELYAPISKRIKPGSRVFACSTFELFHPIADEWRDAIFSVIDQRPDLTFIILTKMPERIDRPMPDNAWLGVTITGEGLDVYRWLELEKAKSRIKFISFEPILFPIKGSFDHTPEIPAWTIWGGLTGHGEKKAEFDRNILFDGVSFFKGAGSKVFIKNNLRKIWGPNLIQEFPE